MEPVKFLFFSSNLVDFAKVTNSFLILFLIPKIIINPQFHISETHTILHPKKKKKKKVQENMFLGSFFFKKNEFSILFFHNKKYFVSKNSMNYATNYYIFLFI
jgi:hypothetical protein